MEMTEAIKKRISVRKFSGKPVSDDMINEMLEAARLAPSGGNGQDWVFGVIRDNGLKSNWLRPRGIKRGLPPNR